MSVQFSTVRLGRVARIRSGDAISKASMAETGVPVFGANGQMGYVPQPNFPQGALCVGRVGSCGAVNHHKYPVFISDNALVVRPARDSVSATFLEYAFRATDFAPLVNQGAMPLLTGGDLADLRVPCPPLATQTAIADFLDRKTAAIDTLIAKKEELIRELATYRKSVIAEAVAPKEGWRKMRLKHLTSEKICTGVGEKGDQLTKGHPRYIRTSDIESLFSLKSGDSRTLPPEVAKTADVQQNDILLTTAGSVGKLYLHTAADGSFCYAGFLARIRVAPSANPRFIAYTLSSKRIQEAIANAKVTSTIDNFSASKCAELPLWVPPLEEQVRVVVFLDKAIAKIESLRAKAEASVAMLKDYRASLIAEAVTGKLVLPTH